jgi:phosphatidylglycerol:prolipoprotein diacylglycerol transferase
MSAYTFFLALAFLTGACLRRVETRRIGQQHLPGHRWVGVGALAGAAVGAKLGMLLFAPLSTVRDLMVRMADLDFSGKTVVGALVGGYLGVELAKRMVGIRVSTGDAFAVALPTGQALGRLGCFFNGCCIGTPAGAPWATMHEGVWRHPVQLYEMVLDASLALGLWKIRHRPYPQGHLFRRYLVGYASIRFCLDFVRADAQRVFLGLSPTQWLCLAAMAGFTALITRRERQSVLKQ